MGPLGELQGCWGQTGGESQSPADLEGRTLFLLPAAAAVPSPEHTGAPHTSAQGTNRTGR